jgi:NAD+ synthase (glutamine-hydrolysing)
MPTVNNGPSDRSYALQLHENLGCNTLEFLIEYQSLLFKLNTNDLSTLQQYNDVADQNIQARLRDVVIMHYANAYNLLPLATGNKTEAALGYYTLFDMNLGFAPIMDCYKDDIYDLAKLDNRIPLDIQNRKPTAALAPNQFDENDLLHYSVLDQIVKHYIEDNINRYLTFKDKTGILESNCNKNDYNKMILLIQRNEFKRRQSTLGLKTTKKSFGTGWKYPVCRG